MDYPHFSDLLVAKLDMSNQMVLSVCQNILGTGIQEWIIQSSFSHKIHIQRQGNLKYTN